MPKQWTKEELKQLGYDGLYADGEDCFCKLENLYECSSISEKTPNCNPGFLKDCGECEKLRSSQITPEGFCNDGWEFCIGPKKENND